MKKTKKSFLKTHKFQLCICAVIAVLAVIFVVSSLLTEDSPDSDDDIGSTVLFTSGDYEMTFDEAYFLTKNTQGYYEAYYLSTGSAINWDAVEEGGMTYEEVVLEESLEYAKEIFIFSEYAKANGITISESELSSIESEVSSFFTENSQKLIDASKVDSDILKRVYIRLAYHDKLCEEIYSDAAITVDRDELKQCLVAAVELGPDYFDSPDLTAKAIMDRVNNGEVITEVAKIYDTTAIKGNVGKGDMDGNAFEQLCLSLGNGECGITEIDGTYFVVYCYLAYDEEATDSAVEAKYEELQAEAVAKFYEELLQEMPVTVNEDIWSTLNFDETIYTEGDVEVSS